MHVSKDLMWWRESEKTCNLRADDASRLYDLFFTENTLVSMETDEAVVLRGDDAGSCSQVQLSVDGALYSVVAS